MKLPNLLRRRKAEPQAPGPDEFGYDFCKDRGYVAQGHQPDDALTNAVAAAGWILGAIALGGFAWLAIWVFWLHT